VYLKKIEVQAPTRHRRSQLLELLEQEQVLSIQRLSRQLDVSPLTIRRDLDVLQQEGIVERLHGGVRMLRPAVRSVDKSEVSFYVRRGVAVAEKQAIARVALSYLKPDEVIFLDASTTALYLIQLIPQDLSLTIVTHSVFLPIELAGHPNLQVISTGGVLHSRSLCYLGAEAENSVRQLSAHRALFGLKGLTLTEGCTDANLLEIRLKGLMAQRAQELIILADHTKLGNIALSPFAGLDQVHALITDEAADPAMVCAIRDRGVQVVLAPLGRG
jgi:DeoR/GlpR family transcriptional regulator of sugar metabolism